MWCFLYLYISMMNTHLHYLGAAPGDFKISGTLEHKWQPSYQICIWTGYPLYLTTFCIFLFTYSLKWEALIWNGLVSCMETHSLSYSAVIFHPEIVDHNACDGQLRGVST